MAPSGLISIFPCGGGQGRVSAWGLSQPAWKRGFTSKEQSAGKAQPKGRGVGSPVAPSCAHARSPSRYKASGPIAWGMIPGAKFGPDSLRSM